jgi:hypothetical protein
MEISIFVHKCITFIYEVIENIKKMDTVASLITLLIVCWILFMITFERISFNS